MSEVAIRDGKLYIKTDDGEIKEAPEYLQDMFDLAVQSITSNLTIGTSKTDQPISEYVDE